MFGESLPIMNNVVGSRSAFQPSGTKLTLEQMYQQAAGQIQPQSSPYEEYKKVLSSCTEVVQEKIVSDMRFAGVHSECENLIKQYLYEQCIPRILETQSGMTAFEKLCSVTKQVRDECIQQDTQRAREIERLLNDELVQERLKEMREEEARGQ